jgi:hypothetical protein
VLDTLLGFGLVPPVVERKIEGKRGSLQAWVERSLARFAPATPPSDMGRANEEMHAMRLFDYLIFNTDRHVRNVVFTPDWRPVAIDNSIAFHAFLRPFRPLYRFPRGPLDRLRRLDARALESRVDRLPRRGRDRGPAPAARARAATGRRGRSRPTEPPPCSTGDGGRVGAHGLASCRHDGRRRGTPATARHARAHPQHQSAPPPSPRRTRVGVEARAVQSPGACRSPASCVPSA